MGNRKGCSCNQYETWRLTPRIASDHYTNGADIHGSMSQERGRVFSTIEDAFQMQEKMFRPLYVGTH